MLLVADLNVLIDLQHVNGLYVLPLLGKTVVLDIVLQESEEHEESLWQGFQPLK